MPEHETCRPVPLRSETWIETTTHTFFGKPETKFPSTATYVILNHTARALRSSLLCDPSSQQWSGLLCTKGCVFLLVGQCGNEGGGVRSTSCCGHMHEERDITWSSSHVDISTVQEPALHDIQLAVFWSTIFSCGCPLVFLTSLPLGSEYFRSCVVPKMKPLTTRRW